MGYRRSSALLSLLLLLQLLAAPWLALAHDCALHRDGAVATHAGAGHCHHPSGDEGHPACGHCITAHCGGSGNCSAQPGLAPQAFVAWEGSDTGPALPSRAASPTSPHGPPPFRPPIHA